MILLYIVAAALVVAVGICTRKNHLWGLYLVMAAVPLSYKIALKGTPLYFLVEIALVPFAFVVFKESGKPLRTFISLPFFAFVPFLAYIAISCLWAEQPLDVFKEIVRWGEFIILGLTCVLVIDPKREFVKPFLFLGWIGVAVSIVGSFQFLIGVNQELNRPGAALLGHPNPTAAFIALCLFPSLGLLVLEGRRHLVIRLSVFLTLLLGLAFTFSRGVFLATAIAVTLFLFDAVRSRHMRDRRAAAIVVGIIVTLAGLACIPRFRHVAVERIISQTLLDGRDTIFAFGWAIHRDHPWLGLGAGNLKSHAVIHNLLVRPDDPFEPNYGDLHNLFLQLLVETGYVGLALFLAALLYCGVALSKWKPPTYEAIETLYWSIWAASLAYLLANCSGFYVVKGIHLVWAVLLALQVAMIREPRAEA